MMGSMKTNTAQYFDRPPRGTEGAAVKERREADRKSQDDYMQCLKEVQQFPQCWKGAWVGCVYVVFIGHQYGSYW